MMCPEQMEAEDYKNAKEKYLYKVSRTIEDEGNDMRAMVYIVDLTKRFLEEYPHADR